MQGYIFELYENIRYNDERIGGVVANKLLKSFINRKICTTYQCYKDLKETYAKIAKSITYKNVHKRVQKLYSLKLIDKVKMENGDPTKHGAIFYKLTSLGIFYAIKNNLVDFNRNIIINNKNNGLFTNFLYPYIQKKLLKKLLVKT